VIRRSPLGRSPDSGLMDLEISYYRVAGSATNLQSSANDRPEAAAQCRDVSGEIEADLPRAVPSR